MKKSSEKTLKRDNVVMFAYLTGAMTSIVIVSLFAMFIGYRVGFANLGSALRDAVIPSGASEPYYKSVLRLPQDVLKELAERNAAIDNAGNPTNQPEHNTVLVRPDERLGFVLIPNVRISVSMLHSVKPFNFDPPVLQIKDDGIEHSNQLRQYLLEESRLQYSYSTDSNGFRSTLPSVESDKKILMIGDSVAFGVGVDDQHTAASHLQSMIGGRYSVINSGVGNYDGHQAYEMAKKVSTDTKFSGLLYVACQNDFMLKEDWIREARDVLTKIDSIADRFNNNVVVMLVTYMQYNVRDIFLEGGWSNRDIENTHALRREFAQISKAFAFEYHDWTDVVSSFGKEQKSIFSRFGLYVDHAHLSPLGNRLMANELFTAIKRKSLLN